MINAQRIAVLMSSISAFALPAMLGFSAPAAAQEAASEEIIVTGTRRAASVQDVPLNIAAVGAAQIEEQGISNLTELASLVPGLHIIDQGGHAAHPIIVRGLNADPVSSNDGATDGGGTVGVYVGEVPLNIDMRLEDISRVEVLMGPQGTLYGSGTLGGAIRYIPNKPEFGVEMLSYRADIYGYEHSKDMSSDIGLTFNIPIADNFAVRGSIDRLEDGGFIDYNYIVREIGVSDPDPDFSNPADVAANLDDLKDANDEDILSGRLAARWEINPNWDATLTYYFQSGWVGGRQISSHRSTLETPEYVSAKRVRETFERNNDLLALEQTLDLGFAELTSATGYSRLFEVSHRDQTDLLLLLNPAASSYYYDNFPTFTAITTDTTRELTFTQEFRIVSTGEGPFSWIGGLFYSDFQEDDSSKEFTPHFSQYLTDEWDGGGPRTDDLEYYNVSNSELTEYGIYGEAGYDVTSKWNVTFGARWYSYDLSSNAATDFPVLNTAFFGAGPDEILLDFEQSSQQDSGWLWKFNTSYEFTDEVMAYFTRSAGFRIGNSNGLDPCTPGGGQSVCASSPSEEAYTSDTTVNYEIGLHSEWFGNRLTLNLATYFIDWEDPQVASATLIGASPITINGSGATSRGYEINFNAEVTDHFTVRGSYAYNDSQLSDDSPNLITVSNSPNGFVVVDEFGVPIIADWDEDPDTPDSTAPLANYRIAGEKGDRLPGSPQQSYSLFFSYNLPMANGMEWDFNYGLTGVSEVLTRTGARGGSLVLPSYIINNASVSLSGDNWGLMLYVKNMFDEFAETGASGTALNNNVFVDDGPGPVATRSFHSDVLPPRTIGLRLNYEFGG